jgi:hypothetical protein
MQTLKPITFETVLSMVKQLSFTDQIRLLEWIAGQVSSFRFNLHNLRHKKRKLACQVNSPNPRSKCVELTPQKSYIRIAYQGDKHGNCT